MKISNICVVAVFLAAACGGSEADASDNYVCCSQSPDLTISSVCAWNKCVPSDNGTDAYVYVYTTQASAPAHFEMKVTGSEPMTGVCFTNNAFGNNAPDWCLTVYTTSDFAEDLSRPPSIYLPSSGWGASGKYEMCYAESPTNCAGRNDFTQMCCNNSQAVPGPMPPNAPFVQLPTNSAMSPTVEPAGFFPQEPGPAKAPAAPVPMLIGLAAGLGGLGAVMVKKRKDPAQP